MKGAAAAGQEEVWAGRAAPQVMKRVYLICPVRRRSDEDRRRADEYVAGLEAEGVQVHYPPRDADQADDGVGLAVNESNRRAMRACDEVHVIWDPASLGSYFDLGMAFMLRDFKRTPIVMVSRTEATSGKSHGNLLAEIARRDRSG